jgi:hypothetical protein
MVEEHWTSTSKEYEMARRRGKYNNKRVQALGCNFRSKFEWRVANRLEKEGIAWEFEPKVKIGDRTVLPDFYLPDFDIFLELRPAKLVDDALIQKIRQIKYTYECEVVLATDVFGAGTFISRLDENRERSNPDKIWVFTGKRGELKDASSVDPKNSE